LPELAIDVHTYGYYGGIRLLKATLRTFYDYCERNGLSLHDRNFSIRYHSSIPRHLGLAGSSAIVTACMRALISYYDVEIPPPVLANLILAVERDELGIGAGLQDRVAQVYQGLVYMDFGRDHMERNGYGVYTHLDATRLPYLYLAFNTRHAEGTEIVHNDLRYRWDQGDPDVRAAMKQFAELTDRFRDMMTQGADTAELSRVMDANFDLRRSIMDLNPDHVRMIEAARSVGASAKFTGSGGAIIGIVSDDEHFTKLASTLQDLGMSVIKPIVAEPEDVPC
jgi:glucuronokinase